MDFTLSKEHLLFRQMVREFVENEIKPIMQEIDEEERFPRKFGRNLDLPDFLVFSILKNTADRAETTLLTLWLSRKSLNTAHP